ncbi:hypothetical protein D3C86_1757380 [compost metagenome]
MHQEVELVHDFQLGVAEVSLRRRLGPPGFPAGGDSGFDGFVAQRTAEVNAIGGDQPVCAGQLVAQIILHLDHGLKGNVFGHGLLQCESEKGVPMFGTHVLWYAHCRAHHAIGVGL